MSFSQLKTILDSLIEKISYFQFMEVITAAMSHEILTLFMNASIRRFARTYSFIDAKFILGRNDESLEIEMMLNLIK